MDYNLLKTLDGENNMQYGEDLVTDVLDDIVPGIGQIAQNSHFDIIIPCFNNSDLTKIEKQNNLPEKVLEQLGGGPENSEKEETVSVIAESNENLTSDQKRKSMDDGIYHSFLHPKMFKTGSIDINSKIVHKKAQKSEKNLLQKKL